VNRRRAGWITFWALAVPLVTMGANCDSGQPQSKVVDRARTRSFPPEFKITIDDGKGERTITVSRQIYDSCPVGSSYPDCAGDVK
jgi:hypothetical protein